MRIPRHWNVRYARDRFALAIYTALHPRTPWLAPDAIRFLEAWLRPDHVGFEWGAGRSTAWFALRIRALTSIEHDARWFRRVQAELPDKLASRVQLRCISKEKDYVGAILSTPDKSLDFVLVDGVSGWRDACAKAALPKLKPQGLLIIDDVHRYLPSESRAPLALPAHASALTPVWDDVLQDLRDWDFRRMSSGVTDTGIWIRGSTG